MEVRTANRVYLDILLDEYKSVRAASVFVDGRIDTLRQITVVALGAVLAFFGTIGLDRAPWLLLAVSMFFSVFGLLLGYAARQVRLLARYEAYVLRQKFESLLEDVMDDKPLAVLEWQAFYRKELFGGSWFERLVSGLQGISTVLLPVGVSSGSIAVYIVTLCSLGLSAAPAEVTLLLASILLWIVMMICFIPEASTTSSVA